MFTSRGESTLASTAEARGGMRLGPTVVRSLREGALWVFGALALIVLAALLTYDRNDPSFATTGEPGPISNVIGPLGAHLSGLLVMLFGAPAFLFPVMIGFAGWLLYQDRSKERRALARDAGVPRRRLRAHAHHQLRSCEPAFHRRRVSELRRRRARLVRRRRDGGGAQLPRRDAAVACAVACGSLAVRRRVVDRGHGSHRPRDAQALGWLSGSITSARADQGRPRSEGSAQRSHSRGAAPRRKSPAAEDRAGRAQSREERARTRRSGRSRCSSIRPRRNCRRCRCSTIRRARQSGYSAEALEAMSRLVELKLRDFDVEAEVVEVHPGPGHHALRAAPCAGRQGQPDQQSGEGPGARAVRGQRARRRSHSGQIDRGPGNPERETRAGHARRDHQVEDLRRA